MLGLMHRAKERLTHTEEGERLKNCEIDDSEIKLIKPLGQGCYGAVYLGECRGTTVAVKVPHIQELSKEELADLRKEIQIMACVAFFFTLLTHDQPSRVEQTHTPI